MSNDLCSATAREELFKDLMKTISLNHKGLSLSEVIGVIEITKTGLILNNKGSQLIKIDTPTIKRGRGRPRNKLVTTTTKRRVGRPKKEPSIADQLIKDITARRKMDEQTLPEGERLRRERIGKGIHKAWCRKHKSAAMKKVWALRQQ